MRYFLRLLISVAVLVLPATAAGAQAPQQAPQKEAVIQEITLRGTVDAVDHAARIVRVKSDQGNIVTLDVPAAYTRFDQVKVGDVVSITYYDRVSVRLKPAGEAPVDRADTTTTTLAPGPGGTRVTQRITTVKIDAWDPATRIVTFTTSKGQTYTRRIIETLDPKVLAGLKVGDQVDVTRTEATKIDVVTPAASAPQQIQVEGNSRAHGFFVGGGYEYTRVAVEDEDETDSGNGAGLTLGYGFNHTLAIYGQFSGASLDDALGSYGLGHFNLGLRVHFLAPAKTVVPFVQFGLSARALGRDDIDIDDDGEIDDVEFGGIGFAVGGGINVHFIPALALTTGVTWSIGNVDNIRVNGTDNPVDAFGATTARIHFGIIWFPMR